MLPFLVVGCIGLLSMCSLWIIFPAINISKLSVSVSNVHYQQQCLKYPDVINSIAKYFLQ